MVPSITTLVFGLAITVVLAVADWYVWRMAPEMPYPMAPAGSQFTETDEQAFKKVA
jgi:hypothetical protein